MIDTQIQRLARQHAQLLVVDIQERLLPSITDHAAVVAQSVQMIRAAAVLGLPVTVSEQYPRGLGATVPEISAAVQDATRLEKTAFSCCADTACRTRVTGLNRGHVLLVGIETHVCVQQTALDLLSLQMQPVVLADAVGSRRPFDRQVALDRMRAAGVIITTVESAIFELLHEAGTELFKRILPLVR